MYRDYGYSNFSSNFNEHIIEGLFSAIGAFIIKYLLLISIITVISAIAKWKIFKKAGIPEWYSLIPIFGTVKCFEIAGMEWWWYLLKLVPGLNFYVELLMAFNLSRAFAKRDSTAVWYFFLRPMFWSLLGFTDDEYVGVSGNGFLKDTKVSKEETTN